MHWSNIFICVVGLPLTFMYDNLSYNKVATQSHTYQALFTGASNAVDGNSSTCTKPYEIGLNDQFKTILWKVDLGDVYNVYSITILFKKYDGYEKRQRGRFAGFSIFISSTGKIQDSTLCFKNGPQLPPLNFTTTCTEHGRYVIFYNERKNGVTYPKDYELMGVFNELCEVVVLGCNKNGVYGSSCNMPCPIKCHGNYCDIKNGTCFGCKPGWRDTLCDKECREGLYGVKCNQQCSGHCRGNIICNHVTGQCDRGCDAGWTGPMCGKECNDGTYGHGCVNNCSGHCLNNFPCNKQTGKCDNGCNPGYTNSDCNKECSSGYFGINCTERCSDHCINNGTCDNVKGECWSGCKEGYIGARCADACNEGYFGKNCSRKCSPNCKHHKCRHTDGWCDCTVGWTGSNCTTECMLSYGENCQHRCNIHCINKTCDRINGSCLYGCMYGEQCNKGTEQLNQEPYPSSKDLPVIVGGTLGPCVILITGVVMTLFVIRLKRKSTTMGKRQSIILETYPLRTNKPMSGQTKLQNCRSQTLQNANDVREATYALPERRKRGPPTNKNIPIRNMKAQIANMSLNENAGFKSEYHDIPRGELHPCIEGKKQENKVKNRYTTIFPYDHSRVILKTVASYEEGYINANYIEDTRERRIYIATQGPKPKTIADFWTMIWQEEVCNIVCLTNLTEGTKNKCAQYWPDVNDKLQGGTLTVRHLEEKGYAEYIIRRFKIHNKSTRTDRHVTMFHYTTWSDHGVADPLSLVVFHRHVIKATAKSAGKYTVVHCSAGVGRTGTYIALDALYREGEKTGKINVPMYVRRMRKDRMNMIQGDDQYKLLYLALKDAFYGQKKCLNTEKFLGDYQEQTCYANCGDIAQKSSYSSDIEELLSLRKEYTQQDYISGRAQISANYTQNVLPVEEFMCHLYYMKGYNTYYNAVLIQSYLEKDSLISAQYPLPDNTEDFLRLIKDFDARVVVFLCPLGDIESTSKWFPPENQHKFNGIFYVKNMSSTRSNNVKITKLNIQPTGFNEMYITLLECSNWKERQKKGDKRVLLDVIKAVKTEKSDHKGRVLVLSSDGATRCGPLFVVYNVLEQISMDREADIFTAVRQIQIRRPECVSTVDEYKLCHDAIAEYLLNDCVYGNC